MFICYSSFGCMQACSHVRELRSMQGRSFLDRESHLCLLGKTLPLDDGVVQLCIRVRELSVVNEQLKTLC